MKTTRNDAGHWQAIVEKLESDRAAVLEQEAIATGEARPLALPSATGDAKATAKLAMVNDRRATLARQVETLDTALADARDRLAGAQQAEADARTAERRVALAEASGEMVARAAAVDVAARGLARAMGDYDQQLGALVQLGLDSTKHRRLANKTMIAGGLHLAGLSGRVPLASCSPHHRKTLRDWTGQMLGDVLEVPARPAGPSHEGTMAEAGA